MFYLRPFDAIAMEWSFLYRSLTCFHSMYFPFIYKFIAQFEHTTTIKQWRSKCKSVNMHDRAMKHVRTFISLVPPWPEWDKQFLVVLIKCGGSHIKKTTLYMYVAWRMLLFLSYALTCRLEWRRGHRRSRRVETSWWMELQNKGSWQEGEDALQKAKSTAWV